jgi:hypothetical protein
MLARRAEALSALVIGTYRDDELGRGHPLRLVLGELAMQPDVESVHLERLSPEAVAALTGGRDIDVDELYRRTLGNPFYVREVLDGDGDTIPATVRDAVSPGLLRASGDDGRARPAHTNVALDRVWEGAPRMSAGRRCPQTEGDRVSFRRAARVAVKW